MRQMCRVAGADKLLDGQIAACHRVVEHGIDALDLHGGGDEHRRRLHALQEALDVAAVEAAHQNGPVHLPVLQDLGFFPGRRGEVEVLLHHAQLAVGHDGLEDAVLHVPGKLLQAVVPIVGLLQHTAAVQGVDDADAVAALFGQAPGVVVGNVVHGLDDGLHVLPGLLLDQGTAVHHQGDRTLGNAGGPRHVPDRYHTAPPPLTGLYGILEHSKSQHPFVYFFRAVLLFSTCYSFCRKFLAILPKIYGRGFMGQLLEKWLLLPADCRGFTQIQRSSGPGTLRWPESAPRRRE